MGDVYGILDQPGLLNSPNSTIGPALARSLHWRLAERGLDYVAHPCTVGKVPRETLNFGALAFTLVTDSQRTVLGALWGPLGGRGSRAQCTAY